MLHQGGVTSCFKYNSHQLRLNSEEVYGICLTPKLPKGYSNLLNVLYHNTSKDFLRIFRLKKKLREAMK